MSTADATADDPPACADDEAILDELAALDLAAARHVHARLMAAQDPAEVSELARAYQRMARSVRQSLALKSKLINDAEKAANTEPAAAPAGGMAIARRAVEVRDAVCRVIWDETERPKDREEYLSDLKDRLYAFRKKPAHLDETLDDHVARLCMELGFAPESARHWRTLPETEIAFRHKAMRTSKRQWASSG